jgi:hypothetical protein
LRASMAANEASSVGSLPSYSMAIETYATQCPDRGFPASPVQLGPGSGDCDQANIIDGQLGYASPLKHGYVFLTLPAPRTDRAGSSATPSRPIPSRRAPLESAISSSTKPA